MPKVALVTDSSCCLPVELIESHRIIIVPLAFLFDGELHYDGTLSGHEFYGRLRASHRFPTTTSPAPGAFLAAFRQAAHQAPAVLCLTLPSAYSGTFSSAVNARELAAQELPGLPIRVLDTHGLAMAHGFAVLAAARAAAAGAGLEEAAAAAEAAGSATHLVGALDTMRYLAKSGRVPWIVHWATSLLGIKPILAADAGAVAGVGRARTMARALDQLLRYLQERVQPGAPLHVAVMHADAPQTAQSLAQQVRQRLAPAELIVTEFTSVMGIHTGPGFIGLAFYSEAEVREPAVSRAADPPALEQDVATLEASLGPLPQPQATPALVVVSGLPGSGKSHFTGELCRRYPVARLESDTLRKSLFARPTHNAEESARLFAACHGLLDSLLARGIPAVLDATNLREIHRRPLYRIAAKRRAKLILVEVQAPPELIRRRLEARRRGENPWDQSEAGPEVYERMRQQAEPIGRPHRVVDTSGDVGPAVEDLVRELQEVRV